MACHYVEKREALKQSALEMGFDGDYIADLLENWGDEVLGTIVELARNGLSVDFIVETLRKFGPMLLELLADLLNRRNMMGFTGEVVPGPVVEGVEGAFLDTILEKFLPQILEKFLPNLIDKFGPQLFEWLTKWLLNNMRNN